MPDESKLSKPADSTEPPEKDTGGDGRATTTEASSDDLQNFVQGLLDKKRQRKYQLELIQQFFDDPTTFGIDAELIPHITNHEELATQRQYLEYRITLLRSILEVLEGELKLLTQAEQQTHISEAP